jgi:hypothetical protein
MVMSDPETNHAEGCSCNPCNCGDKCECGG